MTISLADRIAAAKQRGDWKQAELLTAEYYAKAGAARLAKLPIDERGEAANDLLLLAVLLIVAMIGGYALAISKGLL